eukprot:5079683-Prymnesium_polylepis.1
MTRPHSCDYSCRCRRSTIASRTTPASGPRAHTPAWQSNRTPHSHPCHGSQGSSADRPSAEISTRPPYGSLAPRTGPRKGRRDYRPA